MSKENLKDIDIEKDKSNKIMQIIAKRCAYYRANPSRFIEDFIPSLTLRPFQKILLWAMAHYDMFYIIASRGLGKTYLMAMYGVYKCVCYPHTKYVCVSATQRQGREILLKITDDFMHKSSLLCNEIKKVSIGQNENVIHFKNGSWMRVAVAGDNSRGIRSTVLATDESRMVSQKIVDTVLRPMNSSPRERPYTNKEEYAHLLNEEIPQEFYLSSAWYSSSEMYEKVKTYVANMLDPDMSYFVCDLPYQLSIKNGLLLRETLENEISEATFNPISFLMEREGVFYGAAEDALFDFNTLDNRRVLTESLHDLDYYRKHNLRIPEKGKNELRILSVDVALLASRKHDNDASAILIHSAIPTNACDYMDNIVYIDTQEGLITEELGLLVMRDFYQYDCDFIALDTNGVGLGIADYLMGGNRFDPVYNQTYPCLDCCNNAEMSERCKIKGSQKVIYSIKATSKSNNDMCLALRSAFQNGYINLLKSEANIEDTLGKIRGYGKLTDMEKEKLKMPYIQTTFLINELINLNHDVSNGLIKVKEKSGMRKDRYSSLEYGWYVVQEQAKKLRPKTVSVENMLSNFVIRPSALIND